MAKKEGMMLTDVDSLIHLLESKNKISFADAAKALNSNLATIENWANVLQEEGIVSIKYNLTTPFMEFNPEAVIKHEQEHVKEEEKVEFKDEKPVDAEEEPIDASAETTTEDIKGLIEQTRNLITQGNFPTAKQTYIQIKKSYDSLPIKFLQQKSKIETDLIRLNNELSIALQKEELKRIKQGIGVINTLLKQGTEQIKNKQIDESVQTYNKIKEEYNSLPEGLYGEKTQLAENILTFFQTLTNITNTLHKKDMEEKEKKIIQLVNKIESEIIKRNVEKAIDVYTELKTVYETLPPGFLDKKLDIQEKMINIYRQLMFDKKSFVQKDVKEKLSTIRELLGYAYSYMKKNDMENSVKSFNEAKVIFEKLPRSFAKEYNHAQKMMLDYYRKLIELKKYVTTQTIKTGSSRIHKLIEKCKKAHLNKDYDVAYDLYKDIVEHYNKMPLGFDPKKLKIRKEIYKLYYEVVSGKDTLELGELNPYVKTRYLKLLDLLVNAHEIVDGNNFSLIDQIYNNIYSIYNELPIGIIRKNLLLKEEISKIFEIYRMYHAALSLQKHHYTSDKAGMRSALGYINQNFTSAEKNCYGYVKLLKYVKRQYEKYANKELAIDRLEKELTLKPKVETKRKIEEKKRKKEELRKKQREKRLKNRKQRRKKEEKIELERFQEEKEIKQINDFYRLKKSKKLYRFAQDRLKENDYSTALKALQKLQRLDPNNKEIAKKIIELERVRKIKYKQNLVKRLVAAKQKRLKKYMNEKNYDHALEEVNTILELDPDNHQAKMVLDKINNKKNRARV